jgi:hypothetical protein
VKRSWPQYAAAMLLLLTAWLCGCVSRGKSVTLRPLDGSEIRRVKAGERITADVDGYFLSDDYLIDVLQVDIQ